MFEVKTNVVRKPKKAYKYINAIDPCDGVRKNLTIKEWADQSLKWVEKFPDRYSLETIASRQAMHYRHGVAEERGLTPEQVIGAEPMPEPVRQPTSAEIEAKDQVAFDIRSGFLRRAM